MCGLLHAIGNARAAGGAVNVIGDFGGGAMHLLLGVLASSCSAASPGAAAWPRQHPGRLVGLSRCSTA